MHPQVPIYNHHTGNPELAYQHSASGSANHNPDFYHQAYYNLQAENSKNSNQYNSSGNYTPFQHQTQQQFKGHFYSDRRVQLAHQNRKQQVENEI